MLFFVCFCVLFFVLFCFEVFVVYLFVCMYFTAPTSRYPCPQCPANFVHRRNCSRHVRQKHQQKVLHQCHLYGRGFYRKDKFESHLHSRQQPLKRKVLHTESRQEAERKRRQDFKDEPAVMESTDLYIAPEIQDVFVKSWGAIRSHYHEGRIQSMFNIRWPADQSSPKWEEQLTPVFNRQTKRFKSSSVILLFCTTGKRSIIFFTPLKTTPVPLTLHTRSATMKIFSSFCPS